MQMRTTFQQPRAAGLASVGIAVIVLASLLSGCAVAPMITALATQEGIASYYSQEFQGCKTSNGEIFDNSQLTAAHRQYPFGTIVKVTNLKTNAAVEVRINDRGPVKQERVIDLSFAAAKAIGIDRSGLGRVRLEVVKWGKSKA
jgi:rare lipoprotein A